MEEILRELIDSLSHDLSYERKKESNQLLVLFSFFDEESKNDDLPQLPSLHVRDVLMILYEVLSTASGMLEFTPKYIQHMGILVDNRCFFFQTLV